MILLKFVPSYITVDGKYVKNGIIWFKMFTLIISAFRNNVAKLHLHSLHHSVETNNNVLKLRLLLDLQAIHCRSAATWKQLQSSVAVPLLKWLVAGCSLWQPRFASGQECGVCGGQSGTGEGFLQVLRFPLPVIIPPISPSS
jgi:hypothetical protein